MPILDEFGAPLTIQNATLANPDPWFVEWVRGGPETAAGVHVSETSALRVAAYFACVRNISEDVAKLPLILYERLAPRGKRRADSNPLYDLLHDSPNNEMTSFDFRMAMTMDSLCYGNGYAEIVWAGATPAALYRLDPTKTSPMRMETGEIWYEYRIPGDPKYLPARNVLHIKGIGDGLVGWSIARLARETLGVALAQDKSQGSFLGNDSVPGGILQYPNKIDPETAKRLRREFEEVHRGSENRRRVAVLDQGLEYKPLAIPQEDSQFLELSQFSVEQICRWFRMPPHKVQHLLRATFTNIEQQSLEYVSDTLMPWLVRWEQEIKRKLVPKSNKKLFAEHLVTGLLRGDMQARSAFYGAGFDKGWLSQNDIREFENLNPIGDDGDTYYVPLNMVPSEIAVKGPPEQPKSSPKEPKPVDSDPPQTKNRVGRIIDASRRALTGTVRSLLHAEQDKVKRAAKRANFAEWATEYYDGRAESVTSTLGPQIEALFTATWSVLSEKEPTDSVQIAVSGQIAALASEHVQRSLKELKEPELVEHWTNGRAEEFASTACDRIVSIVTTIGGDA